MRSSTTNGGWLKRTSESTRRTNAALDPRRWQQPRAERDDHPVENDHDLFAPFVQSAGRRQDDSDADRQRRGSR
jgi:hypothetical protein